MIRVPQLPYNACLDGVLWGKKWREPVTNKDMAAWINHEISWISQVDCIKNASSGNIEELNKVILESFISKYTGLSPRTACFFLSSSGYNWSEMLLRLQMFHSSHLNYLTKDTLGNHCEQTSHSSFCQTLTPY